ncbi:MAG: hypothetical protein P8186_32710 [Anaerolineae bacterium]
MKNWRWEVKLTKPIRLSKLVIGISDGSMENVAGNSGGEEKEWDSNHDQVNGLRVRAELEELE